MVDSLTKPRNAIDSVVARRRSESDGHTQERATQRTYATTHVAEIVIRVVGGLSVVTVVAGARVTRSVNSLCGGYNYDSTSIRRTSDRSSHVIKVTVTMDQRRHISLRAFVGQPTWKVVATSAHLPP